MKLTLLLLTLCMAYASARIPNNGDVQSEEDEPNLTIINGYDAERYQFPYMVSFQFYGSHHFCGGSIISESWVVSAAHCFDQPNDPMYKNVTVEAGLIVLGDNNKDVQSSRIANIVLHPKYNESMNDIALIKLELPFFFTKAVQPVALQKLNSEPSGQAWLSGWGVNFRSPESMGITPILQYLKMVVRSNEQCLSIWSNLGGKFKIGETLLCALPLKLHQSGCLGDSGGPLVKDGILIGIVHGGTTGCGMQWNLRLPNLYTKVNLYNQFVRDHVKDLPKANSL